MLTSTGLALDAAIVAGWVSLLRWGNRQAPQLQPRQVRAALRSRAGRHGGWPDAALTGCATVTAAAVVASVAMRSATLLLVAPLPPLGWAVRRRGRHRRRVRRRQRDQLVVVSLLELSLASGVTIRRSMEEVLPWVDGELADDLAGAVAAAQLGGGLAEHLDRLVRQEPRSADLRRLAHLVGAAERHGAPALVALQTLAADLRLDHRRALERDARQLPIRLLAPLIGGVLPAFVLLTIVPMVASAFGSLHAVRP